MSALRCAGLAKYMAPGCVLDVAGPWTAKAHMYRTPWLAAAKSDEADRYACLSRAAGVEGQDQECERGLQVYFWLHNFCTS